MWYIARYNEGMEFEIIESETLERRIYTNEEFLSFLKDGNKITVANDASKVNYDFRVVTTYSDEFYEVISRVEHIEVIDDITETYCGFRFNMTDKVLYMYDLYEIRRHNSQYMKIHRPDLYIHFNRDTVSIYAQGYEYLLNKYPHDLSGVYFDGSRYVLYIGQDYERIPNIILSPNCPSRDIRSINETTFKSFKRRVLLCGI
ncbi:MAG: hypothetical protein K2P14_00970 [Anaeroplasmataceae bacterium]|nr:hypothetical protein [Anaeroplasmataceae bacterium]